MILNRNSLYEYRLYTEYVEEGVLIYSGHKLGVDIGLLDEIINYKYEKYSNKNYYLKYDVWIDKYNSENPNQLMIDVWSCGEDSVQNDLFKSWILVLECLKKINGDFKKIWIIKLNI